MKKSLVPKKYSWDLEDILQGKSLDNLYQQWLNKQKQILKLYPTFIKSLSNFKLWVELGEDYRILSNRLSNYISNNYNEDLVSQIWIGWSQKLTIASNAFSTQLSDLSNQIIKNENIIRTYLKNKDLIKYQREYELIFITKPHLLSDEQEKLISKLSIYHDGFDNIFSTLTDSDIKYEEARNGHGKKVPLKTIADVMFNLKSKDRTLRQSTWINFNKAYANYESTLTQTLYYNYLMLNTNAKIRNFRDYVSSTAFADEIKVELITNIYKNVATFKNNYIKYRKVLDRLLKKQLALKQLEPWDRTVELSKKDLTFDIEQTKRIILNAFKPLGETYLSSIRKAFDEQWISWLPKQNKQTGAYSVGGTKGLRKYYISMNFDKTIRSIATIAHELGHSMHSLYTNKHQTVYTSTSIFYAEIASIVNETLLSYYLLDYYRQNEDICKMILDELIRNFFATTSRQIVFSNFEYEANRIVNQSLPFTKEVIKNLYLRMIDKYQGLSNKDKTNFNKTPYSYGYSTIFRISHFYVGNFYVYKYAIGQIVAILIANKIYQGDTHMINKYFDFLGSGDSKSPIDTIKILGIDLYDKKVYQEVNQIVRQWIKTLDKY